MISQPQSLGINKGANCLHLCPYDTLNMFFHFDYEIDVKRLGFIKVKRKKNHYVESYPILNASKVIRHFMYDDFNSILAIK